MKRCWAARESACRPWQAAGSLKGERVAKSQTGFLKLRAWAHGPHGRLSGLLRSAKQCLLSLIAVGVVRDVDLSERYKEVRIPAL